MRSIRMDQIKGLIEQAHEVQTSGHPFLDRRWLEEGADKRNHCYRRTYYRFCMLLASVTKPDLIVELGIDEGDCCGHWAQGCETASVVGVDIHKDGEPPSLVCQEVARNFLNFKYVRKWSWEAARDLEPETKIDILFIDSWHEFDYFARDWNDWTPYLSDNAIVIVDDLHMGQLLKAFRMLQGDKYVDKTMNPAVPFGIILSPEPMKLSHENREYMS